MTNADAFAIYRAITEFKAELSNVSVFLDLLMGMVAEIETQCAQGVPLTYHRLLVFVEHVCEDSSILAQGQTYPTHKVVLVPFHQVVVRVAAIVATEFLVNPSPYRLFAGLATAFIVFHGWKLCVDKRQQTFASTYCRL